MKLEEFAEVIEVIEIATGCAIDQDAKRAIIRTKVYYDFLGDLPLPALRAAAEQLVCQRKWANFPQVAEIRELAATIMAGLSDAPGAGEAWAMAVKACGRCDVESEGSVERAMADVPPLVREAIRQFGFMALYNPDQRNLETMRAQFRGIYESLLAREKSMALLPPGLRARIRAGKIDDAIEDKTPASVKALAATIGKGI